jgi:HEAT repeat protein
MLTVIEGSGNKYTSVVSAFAGAPDEAISELTARLSSPDSLAAFRAAHALGAMGPRAKAAIPALTTTLRREAADVRAAAASALGDIGASDPNTLAALRSLLEDPDQAVRSAAQGVLFKFDPKSPP